MAEPILEQSKKAKGLGKLGGKAKTLLVILLLLGGAYYGYGILMKRRSGNGQRMNQVKTATVTKGDITQAVETDGTVAAEDGVELSFATTGETVDKVYVKVGDMVKKGDKIASISTSSLQFDLKNAQDSYQSALLALSDGKAGASEKDIKNSQLQVQQAQQALDQANASLVTTKADADAKVNKAQENITTAQKNISSGSNDSATTLNDNYTTLYTDIESMSLSYKTELYNADKILGVDDTSLNDSMEAGLGVLNSSALSSSKISYSQAKSAKARLDTMLATTNKTNPTAMNSLEKQAATTASAMKELYGNLQTLLDGTITTSTFSQSSLDSFKSNVSSTRASINGNVTTLGKDMDAISKAGTSSSNSADNLQTAYNDAVTNLADVKRQNATDIQNAQNTIVSKQSALDQANLNYSDLIAPLTTSELQKLVSQVNQAKNNLEQVQNKISEATLTSPIDGEVGAINGKEGSLISANSSESFATIINKDTLFVKVNVEESDINNIRKQQKAYVTFDAIEGLKMEGTVTFISMTANTSNSGVVTYEVHVVLDNVGQTAVKSGMTAFVSFVSDEVKDVLTLPVASVTNVDGTASVELEDGTYQDVVTGFTDGKTVEIVSGLNEGDKVVY